MEMNVKYEMPELNEQCKSLATTWQVVQWPETIAMLQRLGVDLSRPYKRIIVDLNCDELSRVYLEQLGADAVESAKQAADKPTVIDTTSQHNEDYRTKV